MENFNSEGVPSIRAIPGCTLRLVAIDEEAPVVGKSGVHTYGLGHSEMKQRPSLYRNYSRQKSGTIKY